MYAKIFSQIYDGTLCTNGPWQALVTFQQLLILADQDGDVDMTPAAISRKTTIPIEIIELGIAALLLPDAESRTPTEGGRRIIPLAEGRSWGWKVVNYKHYRQIKREEDRREYHREYWKKRKLNQDSTPLNTLNTTQPAQPIAEAYTYAEANTVDQDQVRMSGEPDLTHPVNNKNHETRAAAKAVLLFLNEKTERNFKDVPANLDPIISRLKEGYTQTQLFQVIAKKRREWMPDEKMRLYLRPKTLFNRTNFANYAGELLTQESKK